ncbi:MAG: translation initiation factor IF-6 [Thermoplasmatota archaeon]
MAVRLADIDGNPYIGVFCRLIGDIAVVPLDVSDEFAKLLETSLDIRTVRATLGGTNLHGSLISAGSAGMIVPYFFNETDIRKAFEKEGVTEITDSIRIAISDDPTTSWGNNVLLSERAALINPDLTEESADLVRDTFDVEVERGTIAGVKTVGSVASLNSRGMVVHPKATNEDMARLTDLFGIDVKISTANFGSPYLGASIIANDRGALIGNKSSGVEVNRIEDTLDLIE